MQNYNILKPRNTEGSGLEEIEDDEDYSGDDYEERYDDYENKTETETPTYEGKIRGNNPLLR